MIEPMSVVRGLSLSLSLSLSLWLWLSGLALMLAGCLAAPPSPGESDSPDASAATASADAAAACASIARDPFDEPAVWVAYAEPGSTVTPAPDHVRITAQAGGALDKSYGDLHSQVVLPVAGTELRASVDVVGDAGPVGGISWTHDDAPGPDDDDYYDLLVDGGYVHAARKPAFGDREVLCAPDCPPYDPGLHTHLRLLVAGGDVVFQTSPDGSAWSDLAGAPLADLAYRSVAFAYADAPASTEMSVTALEWADCRR